MHRFTVEETETTKDSSKDLQQSSRYDDRELMLEQGNMALFQLEEKLHKEIDSCSERLDKLERLAERYHEDGVGAKSDNNMAYYQRYAMAYERVQMMINSLYGQLPLVV